MYLPGVMNFTLRDECPVCGFDYTKQDSADGPAVFLSFVLGFLIVPLAVGLEVLLHPPLWVHAALWTALMLAATMGSLKPLKSYIILLQYKHRATDWNQ